MSSRDCVLGIDLGTSSVKLLLKYRGSTVVKVREEYKEAPPAGWWKAVKKALSGLDLKGLAAIGLSSQVGTYLVDGRHVIAWSGKEGTEELAEIKGRWNQELFLEEISMPHPNLISYPLPRLLYIRKHHPEAEKICQPKDFLCEMLTGNLVTDPYSWRGLANLTACRYSTRLLEQIGVSSRMLPEMKKPLGPAGFTRETALEGNVLPGGIPVYIGMNDFYASLLGMGVLEVGDMFDITGTSEHLGVIESEVRPDTGLVSSPYIEGNVHYGVTASSGASLAYGMELFGYEDVDPVCSLNRKPPVFLPYLNGERAPIWDADARGMFFGIHGDCTKSDMAYAVLEGVLFSLYHIYESMGMPPVRSMRIAGGAAANTVLGRMKAEMFGVPVFVPDETDTSALGACIIAAVGLGRFRDYQEAVGQTCTIRECIKPCGRYKKMLEKRYTIYKELYPATKKLL